MKKKRDKIDSLNIKCLIFELVMKAINEFISCLKWVCFMFGGYTFVIVIY